MCLDIRNVAALKTPDGVRDYIQQSGLGEALVDHVYIRVSQIHACAYCQGLHTCNLAEKGMGAEKLARVGSWREAGPVFDQRERAALAWAETVARVAETVIGDDAFDAVSGVFSEKEVFDLTVAIVLLNTRHWSTASP